jgi:hypothetical protein
MHRQDAQHNKLRCCAQSGKVRLIGIKALRAKQRGEGHDLTQREARALAGEWYKWFVDQHEDNPGRPRDWEGVCWAFEHDVEEGARDPETGEIGELDMEDPEVREYARKKVYPHFADEAAQFLASRGEVLTPAAMTMFLNELISEYHRAITLLQRADSGDCGQVFRLIADSDSDRSRTAFR